MSRLREWRRGCIAAQPRCGTHVGFTGNACPGSLDDIRSAGQQPCAGASESMVPRTVLPAVRSRGLGCNGSG